MSGCVDQLNAHFTSENICDYLHCFAFKEATRQKLKSDATYHRLSLEKREALRKDMEAAHKTRLKLERRKNASALERNLGYPLVMLCIIALTGLALFLVSAMKCTNN